MARGTPVVKPRAAAGAREAMLAAAVDACGVAIGVSHAPEGAFVEVNDAFLRLFGYTRSEVIGRTSSQLRLWPVHGERERFVATLEREGRATTQARYRAKDGSTGDVLVNARVVDFGGERYLVGAMTDVSERVAYERVLSRNLDRLRAVLHSTDVLFFHQDRDLRYTWIANPALGITESAVVGRTDEELLDAEEARRLVAIKRRVLRTGKGERHELWVARGDQRGCFDFVVVPDHDPAGRVNGLLCVSSDVTARKLAEEALEAAGQRLRELAVHLQDAIEDERTAVARDVHDQIGAALTGIRMRLEALGRRAAPQTRRELRAVESAVENAMTSTREILSRLRPPALDDLGLAETLRWYLREWSRETGLRARGRFPSDLPDLDPSCRLDLFRIAQELLTNVARHAGATRVSASLSWARGRVRLRVADDGRGFDAAKTERGFGLAGVRERASRHGGTVRIESGTSGSTVTVVLPTGADE